MKNERPILITLTLIAAIFLSAYACAQKSAAGESAGARHTEARSADPDTLFSSYYRTGEYYYVNGLQNIALDYFLDAADHAVTPAEKSKVFYAIGISSNNIHNASRGIDPARYFQMAEVPAKQSGDSVMVAHALFGRAGMYFDFLGAHKIKDESLTQAKTDSIRTAVELLGEAKEYAPGMVVLDYALALSYAALKDFDKARSRIDAVTGDTDSAQGTNVRASLLISMGRYAAAAAMAQRAYDIGMRTNNEADMRNSLHILYYARKYSGDAEKALDAFERYSEKWQMLMDESLERQVNVAQVRFDTKLKEEKLAATEKENALYRRRLLVIGCAFLLVAALLVVIVVSYRKIRKAHRALAQKSVQWAHLFLRVSFVEILKNLRRQATGDGRKTRRVDVARKTVSTI